MRNTLHFNQLALMFLGECRGPYLGNEPREPGQLDIPAQVEADGVEARNVRRGRRGNRHTALGWLVVRHSQ